MTLTDIEQQIADCTAREDELRLQQKQALNDRVRYELELLRRVNQVRMSSIIVRGLLDVRHGGSSDRAAPACQEAA